MLRTEITEQDNLKDLGVGMSKDNIKTNVKEIGCEGMDWIKLAQVKSILASYEAAGLKAEKVRDCYWNHLVS
jgi:hypothetical protein